MNESFRPSNVTKHTLSLVLGGVVIFSMLSMIRLQSSDQSSDRNGNAPSASAEPIPTDATGIPSADVCLTERSVRRVRPTDSSTTSQPAGMPISTRGVAKLQGAEDSILQNIDKPPIVQIDTRDGRVFGLPIARFADESWFMRNDAAILRLSQEDIVSEQILPVPFEPIASSRLVDELRKEFGANYSVRRESPYVFVTKSSHGLQWVARFRSLYQSMQYYCRSQGYVTRTLDFPLIAIVLGSEEEFLQYARSHDAEIPPHCVGFYSQRDNRIVMFEDAQKMSKQETLDTICHEAAHQLAFNMGLHQRCSGVPLWLAEGFATMFEAPALVSANAKGRTNWPGARQLVWERLADNNQTLHSAIESLIRNDNLFKQDPDLAYTVSWAMTHYLSNVHSKRFGEYVHETSQLPPFQTFPGADRWAHFRSVFEVESGKLTHQLQRYMSSLR